MVRSVQGYRGAVEAKFRESVLSCALETANYDGLSVAEVSRRIEGLPAEQLEKVREFKKDRKIREILVGQIDRKIRASKSS